MNKLKYYILLITSLTAWSCSQDSTDIGLGERSPESLSYISFTRATSEQHTIEEEVRTLHVLIFDASSKELKYNKEILFDKQGGQIPHRVASHPIALLPAEYDFYFLANASSTLLSKLSHVKYVNDLLEISMGHSDYLPSAIQNKGILMTAMYPKVSVRKGGTQEQPLMFAGLPAGSIVELERTVAKVSVHLRGDGTQEMVGYTSLDAEELLQKNSFLLKNSANTLYPFTRTSQGRVVQHSGREDLAIVGTPSYANRVVYAPDLLFADGQPTWSESSSEVTYIQLLLEDDTRYQIPVVSNFSESWQGINYLEFARGYKKGPNGEEPDYQIRRNEHYRFNVTLNQNSIDLTLTILPWTTVDSDYDGYLEPVMDGPHLEINDLEFYGGYMLRIRPNQLTPPFSFWLKEPETAEWRATLSNGHNFKLVGSDAGIADSNEATGRKEIRVTTHAVSDLSNGEVTEFYFTVNGKEVPLTVTLTGGDKYVFYGVNNRLLVQIVK